MSVYLALYLMLAIIVCTNIEHLAVGSKYVFVLQDTRDNPYCLVFNVFAIWPRFDVRGILSTLTDWKVSMM